MELSEIKYVGAYLRKSRGDEETALEKHAKELSDLAARHGWRVEWYKEIGTSDSIDARPEMVRLLRDVEEGLLDAVLVVELDRLSRGELADQARWRGAFEASHTLIITPTHMYNLTDDSQALMADIEGLFARHEYRMITKRLRQGKRTGAKLGRWTNGPAPLPYRYDAATKQLVVAPEQVDTYLLMKERALADIPVYKIAVELNQRGLLTVKGKYWEGSSVYRVLISEVHLGMIVQGKTTGSGHRDRGKFKPVKRRPREEWIVAQGTHPPLKTPEEHARIMELMERRRLMPKMSRRGTYVLSGLVRCGQCGNTHQFMTDPKGSVKVKKCQHTDPMGKACGNRGVMETAIFDALNRFLSKYEADLLQGGDETETSRKALEAELKGRRQSLHKLENSTERIRELFIDGDLSKQDYQKRMEKHDSDLRKVRDDAGRIQQVLASMGRTHEERRRRTAELRANLGRDEVPPAEQNRLLRQVIDRIVYTRPGEKYTVEVIPL